MNNHGNVHKSLIGDLPKHKDGVNAGRLHRVKAAKLLGWPVEVVSKAYNNWVQTFRIPGSSLKFSSYCKKLVAAGITPVDVGCTQGKWNLARINDVGPYTEASCRFVPQRQNIAEQDNPGVYTRTLRKYGAVKTRELQRAAGRKSRAKQLGRLA